MKPERTCVGCSKRDQSSALIRFKAINGKLDNEIKASGRGAWLHPSVKCFEKAKARKAFERVLLVSNLDLTGLLEKVEQAEKMLEQK